MEPTIEITVTPTERQYRQMAHFNAYLKKPQTLPLMTFVAVFSLAMVWMNAAGVIRTSAFVYIGSITILALMAVNLLMVEYSISRYLKSDQLGVIKSRRLVFGEDGFTCETPGQDTCAQYGWDRLGQAFETKAFFLLYLNVQQAFCLPKDQMTEQQALRLRELLKARLGSRMEIRVKG